MPKTTTVNEPQYDARMSMRFCSEREEEAIKIGQAIGQDKTFVYRTAMRFGLEKFSSDPMGLLKYSIRKNKQDKKRKKK